MFFVDTHCHLDFHAFDSDRESVMERAAEAGITHIVNPGIDLETCQKAVSLSSNYDQVYAAVGIHPNDALTWTSNTLAELRSLANDPKVVAVGEIGLDYYRDSAPPEVQREIFLAQLGLADELEVPVIVHCRSSMEDILTILKEWVSNRNMPSEVSGKPIGVLHSFEGNLDAGLEAVRLGFLIGISGPVTFKNAPDRKAVIAGLPLESLVLETDAPFLAPHPYRGRRNEPAYIPEIAKTVAELHYTPIEAVADITSQNAARLYAWRP